MLKADEVDKIFKEIEKEERKIVEKEVSEPEVRILKTPQEPQKELSRKERKRLKKLEKKERKKKGKK